MRHLWSLLAGLLAAPLTWVLIAMGQSATTETVTDWVQRDTYDTMELIEPASYLAAAGVLLGLLATLRISPLGPMVGGLLFAAPQVGMFIDPLAVRDTVPDHWEILDRQLPLRLPLDNGTLLLLGALLLMAVFSAQRWRRWPAQAGTPAQAGPADSAELTSLLGAGDQSDPAGPAPTAGTGPEAGAPASPAEGAEGAGGELPRRTPARADAGDGGAEPAAPQQRAEDDPAPAGTDAAPAASPWSAPPAARPPRD